MPNDLHCIMFHTHLRNDIDEKAEKSTSRSRSYSARKYDKSQVAACVYCIAFATVEPSARGTVPSRDTTGFMPIFPDSNGGL